MGTRIIKKYQIEYLNNGFTQVKTLVKREDWEEILKPTKHMISILESDNKGKETLESKQLKKVLKSLFEDYGICFPENSPLDKSIKTGILSLPITQGGDHPVKWKVFK